MRTLTGTPIIGAVVSVAVMCEVVGTVKVPKGVAAVIVGTGGEGTKTAGCTVEDDGKSADIAVEFRKDLKLSISPSLPKCSLSATLRCRKII